MMGITIRGEGGVPKPGVDRRPKHSAEGRSFSKFGYGFGGRSFSVFWPKVRAEGFKFKVFENIRIKIFEKKIEKKISYF